MQQVLIKTEWAKRSTRHATNEATDHAQKAYDIVGDRVDHHEVLYGADGAGKQRRRARVAVEDGHTQAFGLPLVDRFGGKALDVTIGSKAHGNLKVSA